MGRTKGKKRWRPNLCDEFAVMNEIHIFVHGIEILGATLEETCLKKGIIFSADLHPIL
jgi:hypothetical protein